MRTSQIAITATNKGRNNILARGGYVRLKSRPQNEKRNDELSIQTGEVTRQIAVATNK